MNKNDSNFKIKVSRSLTDLQNSLDEACRLGLPPNLGEQLQEQNDSYFCEAAYNFKNDLTYKSASNNLERFIASHERRFGYDQYSKETSSQFLLQPDQPDQINNNSLATNRKSYIDTLRMLATHKPVLPRSQSFEVLDMPQQRYSRLDSIDKEERSDIGCTIRKNHELECEVDNLRHKLIEKDEEMMRMRSIMFRNTNGSPRSADMRSFMDQTSEVDQEPYEELRRRIDIFKSREVDLLDQLNSAITTIEDAKLEEMQAVLKAEQVTEELENMQARFKELVEEHQRKLQSQSALEEKSVQEAIRQMNEEVTSMKFDLGMKCSTIHSLEEQLKTSKYEIERLNGTIDSMQYDKLHVNEDVAVSVTKAILQRDEALAQSDRLQKAIDKDRCKHAQEKSVMQEEMIELRNRLNVCENAQLCLTQDKIDLVNENSRIKYDMMQMGQALGAEKKRLKAELDGVVKGQEGLIKSLQEELARKHDYFQAVITDAEAVMRQQIMLINKLKHELCVNVHDMDGFVDRHRDEVGMLQNKLERTSDDLVARKEQVRQCQVTIDEYSGLMEDMRTKYRDVDDRRTKQDTEIIEHLSRQNELMRVVEMLTRQLQELRPRMMDCNCGAFDIGDDVANMTALDKAVNFEGRLVHI